jgi:Ca2+-binding EF-hand superfamily protein
MNKDYRLELTKQDIDTIYKSYDAKGTGELDYENFLWMVRVDC